MHCLQLDVWFHRTRLPCIAPLAAALEGLRMKEALRTAMMVSKAGNLFFQVGAMCPPPVVVLGVGCSRLAQRQRVRQAAARRVSTCNSHGRSLPLVVCAGNRDLGGLQAGQGRLLL